jgi:MFS superfamily sulfate permease-like transporter
VSLGEVVALIPMAALVAVMIFVSIATFDWHSIRTVAKWATRRAKSTMAVSTPSPTPTARLWVATVATTALGEVVALIPMAALVAVMIFVSIATFDWHSIRPSTRRPPRGTQPGPGRRPRPGRWRSGYGLRRP